MKTLEILLPVDGSEWSAAAARYTCFLAQENSEALSVTALHVVGVMGPSGATLRDIAGRLGFEPVLVPGDVESFYMKQGRAHLDLAEATFKQSSVPFQALLEQGNIVERILHHSARADLVIMGARGLTETTYPGFGGGTLERVVKALETSVLVVPKSMEQPQGILLAYDGSEGSGRALRAVRHLLELRPLPVHAVHVTQGPVGADPLLEVQQVLADSGVALHCHRIPGLAREVLPKAAKDLGCDLIAIGYRGHSIVQDIFLGRTTEWLLRYVDTALLIAR